MSCQGDGPRTRRPMAGIRTLVLLHALLFLYSLTGVLSKGAAEQPFLGTTFVLLYGGMLVILFVYALAWQQIIRRLPLTVAYANKAINVVWGITWGLVVFHEPVSPRMIIGAGIVVVGVVVFSLGDDDDTAHVVRSTDDGHGEHE